MRGTVLIEWIGLTKSFGRRRLFADVNGSVAPGDRLVVTGLNGVGKSTLLRIVAGLARADKGTVRRFDTAQCLGYAAPDMSLYPELTGRENLEFVAALSRQGRRAVGAMLERVGLVRAADRPLRAYSTGMRQRLKLAAALLPCPQILILDEPTVALDTIGVQLVDEIVEQHTASGGGCIVATNDPAEAQRWATSRLNLVR